MHTEIEKRTSDVRAACLAILAAMALAGTAGAAGYTQINLVSDVPGLAAFTDTNLVNAWGLIVNKDSLIACATESSVANLYSRSGQPLGASIAVDAEPTGVILNRSGGFRVPGDPKPRASTLLFATEEGKILGWSPKVNMTEALVVLDHSASNAVYKGVAMARARRGSRLYATNFRGGVVEMFDEDLNPLGTFTDPQVDAGFAPFGIVNIKGLLYVTFAKQAPPDLEDDLPGAGNGFVDVFDTDGHLVRSFAAHGVLNSPWGVALAPKKFGPFSNALLIGNFGDGTINAFDVDTGAPLGRLSDSLGAPIQIDGLWALAFGKAIATGGGGPYGGGGPKNDVLYFTAGPAGETHGLVGRIVVN